MRARVPYMLCPILQCRFLVIHPWVFTPKGWAFSLKRGLRLLIDVYAVFKQKRGHVFEDIPSS